MSKKQPLAQNDKIPAFAGTRVLQLIDTLEAGGAERVAVNFANGLLNHIEGSYLCATRAEGLLKGDLKEEVGYLFLNKKSTLDFKAIRLLNRFIKRNNIDILHAHSSSYFIATLIKLLNPKLKLVWHDHYGNRINLSFKNIIFLKVCSLFFSHLFVVSNNLQNWAKKNLYVKNVTYIQNYPVENSSLKATTLKGEKGKKIICLANLRPDKNHQLLINAFYRVVELFPEWTLHLVGKDNLDQYSKTIKELISLLNLTNHVYIYNSCPDISNILKQSQIATLSSKSEGLPIALLEYGLLGLPTIVTNVGQCASVITNNKNGLVVETNNENHFFEALKYYIEDSKIRLLHGEKFKNHILKYYSEDITINNVVNTYNTL